MLGQHPPRGANVPLSALPPGLEYEPVNLVSADGAPSRGIVYRRKGTRPRVGVHLMHPRTDQSHNYNIGPLAAAGYLVLGRGGRSVNNDVDTVHEEVLLDVAAGVQFLREAGCDQVVLLGNSGGGSLAALYQSQATTAPAARLAPEPYTEAALRTASLPAADGLALIGIHVGEGRVLMDMLDPSVTDEHDPFGVNPDLDMYDPANGFVLPPGTVRYDRGFLERYREGQARRVRRLDELARAAISAQGHRGGSGRGARRRRATRGTAEPGAAGHAGAVPDHLPHDGGPGHARLVDRSRRQDRRRARRPPAPGPAELVRGRFRALSHAARLAEHLERAVLAR